MIWGRTARGWERDIGRIGWLEVVTDTGDRWALIWSNFGIETVLSTHETDEAAKAAGHWWIDIVRTELGNVSAASVIEVDEE